MNKIININLAGRLIPIDELAYEQLRTYVDWLRSFFGREPGGDEIVRDMEDRIGELFQDKIRKGAACILGEDVQQMIGIMGSPEQIVSEAGEDMDAKANAGTKEESRREEPFNGQKRLTRNVNDQVWGGVCSGIASYFNTDPLLIRLAFALVSIAWGMGFVIYIILWAVLPPANTPATALRKRLYRNPEQKVVGGVCSGIAAYFNIDTVIPRLIFIVPLLGTVFFGVVNSDIFFFPLMTGGIPTMVLLYIILWASLPEANTVAQKLEMRGEKVDVQNLSMAIKDIGDRITKAVPEKTGSGLRRMISILIKIFVFCVLGFILFVLGIVLIATLGAIFGLATSSVLVLPLTGLVTDSETQKWLLWACVILTLVIPFVSIIRVLIRVISGRKSVGGRWVNITSGILFIAGIFGLFWIGGAIIRDFKTVYHSRPESIVMTQPVADTLVIRHAIVENEDGGIVEYDWGSGNEGIRFRDDSSIAISNINLDIEKSPDSAFHMAVQRSAHGKNSRRAQQLANDIRFNYRQEGNVLYLPQDFIIPDGQPFRGQELSVTLQVPEGKVFQTDGISDRYYNRSSFRFGGGHWEYERTHSDIDYDDGKYYKMGPDGKGIELP